MSGHLTSPDWQPWLETKHPQVTSKVTVNMVQFIRGKTVSRNVESSFDCKFFGSMNARIDMDIEVSHEIDYDKEVNPIIVTKYHNIRKFSGYLYFMEGWKVFRADLIVECKNILDARFRIVSGNRYKPGSRNGKSKSSSKTPQV